MSENKIDNKEILISGGTGSLGRALVKLLLEKYKPKGIRIFSRGELLQWEMKNDLYTKYGNQIPVSFLIGDIRDRKRIELATKGVDILIHAAALKQVPACEANPLETIQTNIYGSQNVLYAALENNVKKVIAVSTDKACYPVNLYGSCKLCMEKLFIQGNIYGEGAKNPKCSIVRYGNVLGSRGSVVPLFKKQIKEQKCITITHKDMTRFWITLEDVADFVLKAIENMIGGEIFIPNMPSASVLEIAKVILGEDVPFKEIGIRPGEKIHESLVSLEESRQASYDTVLKCYKIIPNNKKTNDYAPFEYRSNTNTNWLTKEKIKEMIENKD